MINTLLIAGPVNSVSAPMAGHTNALLAGVHLGVQRAAVSVNPNGNLPGTAQLTSLVGGLMTWVLLACVVAVLAGAATWGSASRSGHLGAS